MLRYFCLGASLVFCLAWFDSASADEIDELLEAVTAVEPRGEGNPAAAEAVRELSQADASTLTRILAAMDDANPLAVNWLRGAFESVAARAQESDDGLPATELEAFVLDLEHSGRARRLAYEWLVKADPSAPDRIIPNMLDDPSPEMRRDAVARLISAAEELADTGDAAEAKSTYEKALTGATDGDQVEQIAKSLDGMGTDVDLVNHFGFLTEWRLIGPFDNRDKIGFEAVYPPEQELDFDAVYEGQLGEVRWETYEADCDGKVYDVGEVGKFDLAALTEPHKGAVTYAATEFVSDTDRPVEFRIATPNAWKLWVNGEYLFGHEEYHRGMRFDQYSVRGELKSGRNTILLKVCQNEQTESWAQDWVFQFRVCDLSGKGLTSGQRTARADAP
ncbi:MAG: hypothetical protein DWQ34_08175 [Planctomycetota bacterium]|nr:MAG: hypothetical protein DWQ34_08175 [Planctomycetota bacterium]REK31339.1 MAG: hypothetical protein DWQ41_00360 [Planctomycetota bacterium]REK39064.1 MAG: hypothetical protein DWQ45_02400 [Planctomycetota bacterium]